MYKHIYTDNLLTRTYMCIHIKRHMNAYIYVYVCMHMTICIHMSAHMYTHMYICIYIYTNTYALTCMHAVLPQQPGNHLLVGLLSSG